MQFGGILGPVLVKLGAVLLETRKFVKNLLLMWNVDHCGLVDDLQLFLMTQEGAYGDNPPY